MRQMVEEGRMKIAVTGGTGRIGAEIVRQALDRGDEVVSIDRAPSGIAARQGLHEVVADVVDYDALVAAFKGCDAVIHMAAIPSPGHDPDHIVHNNNVVGSYNVLRAAVEKGIMRICQASSVNAIGHSYSRAPRYDYFPLDEEHPTYCEDPYSLSKWICEAQADAFARLHDGLSIASMRFHWVTPLAETVIQTYREHPGEFTKNLRAYTMLGPAADACLRAIDCDLVGHEVFFIVAPDTAVADPSRDLAARFCPDVPIRGDLTGRQSFFSSEKATRLLGWVHPGLDAFSKEE
jgi:nucleoside-diphosphate-sugar epimerase